MNNSNKKVVTYDFWGNTLTNGITRAKRHQMGVKGDVGACLKIIVEIKLKNKEACDKKKDVSDAF